MSETTLTVEKIKASVMRAVRESLALEPGEVTENARLVDDLGMDSLDFLDIMFLLEKEFDRKIRDENLDRVLRPDPVEVAKMDSFLDENEIAKLAPMIPLIKEEAAQRKIKRQDIFSYVTVLTLVKMVEQKLLQAPSSGD